MYFSAAADVLRDSYVSFATPCERVRTCRHASAYIRMWIPLNRPLNLHSIPNNPPCVTSPLYLSSRTRVLRDSRISFVTLGGLTRIYCCSSSHPCGCLPFHFFLFLQFLRSLSARTITFVLTFHSAFLRSTHGFSSAAEHISSHVFLLPTALPLREPKQLEVHSVHISAFVLTIDRAIPRDSPSNSAISGV